MRKALFSAILFIGLITCVNAQVRDCFTYDIPFPAKLSFSPDTVSVFIIGDVMMHRPQLKRDHRMFLHHIAPKMKEADFAVANMEFPLGGTPYSGYPAFCAPDYMLEYLAECGTDVVLTANNHIFDRGAKGLKRTLEQLRAAGDSLRFTGTFGSFQESRATNPLMLEKDGFRIALVNFTYGINGMPSGGFPNVNYMVKDSVVLAVSRAKEQKADFIVALPHWGEEYRLRHSKEQQEWAKWLSEQGVDAIVGSHPHVVQDSSHIGRTAIVYSMGNAVSNMSAKNTRLELAVVLRFVRNCLTGRKSMIEPELRFMWCTLPGTLTDSYATIFVKDWIGRRQEWKDPSDYDNMIQTYERVRKATGIED